ncbi:pentapeptide repeat-containing protein [Sinomonas susongensis]|uniref:pentapeptide repeat-containing protein n=1 Tax=Sinomonas susongensis TaxID=1324851 RepID=UPI003CCC8A5D
MLRGALLRGVRLRGARLRGVRLHAARSCRRDGSGSWGACLPVGGPSSGGAPYS